MTTAGMPASGPVWRRPGMPLLLASASLGFAGYAALLPTAPLWVVDGGVGTGGAGMTTAVLMLFTVLSQPGVPWMLRRLGWSVTLVTSLILLGAPSILHLASHDLGPVLVLNALRGAGFGILGVCASSAVVRLVEPGRRGSAIGAYGFSIALPQFVLIPAAPWAAENVGFAVVFLVGLAPLLGVPFAIRLSRRLEGDQLSGSGAWHGSSIGWRLGLTILGPPILILLSVTAAGGALLTFAAQMLDDADVALASLLAFTGTSTIARWRFGALADRFGPQVFHVPLLVNAAVGLGLIAWSISGAGVALFVIGMLLVGLSYGGLQNLTLVDAFGRAEHYRIRETVSVSWNIGFDAGTGLGSMFVGFLAASYGFDVGLIVSALICLAMVPLGLVRRATGKDGSP